MMWEILPILASLCFQGYKALRFSSYRGSSSGSYRSYYSGYSSGYYYYSGNYYYSSDSFVGGIVSGVCLLIIVIILAVVWCCVKADGRVGTVIVPDKTKTVSYISGQQSVTTQTQPCQAGAGPPPNSYGPPPSSTGLGPQLPGSVPPPTGFDHYNNKEPEEAPPSYETATGTNK